MTQDQTKIDITVIEACKKGNKLAQYALYNQYSKAMYNLAYRMMNNKEDAEDMLQDAFTDVKIVTPPESSFSIDLKLDDCPAVIPSEWQLEETILGTNNNEYIYQGIIGDKNTRSRIILNLTKGNLSLY